MSYTINDTMSTQFTPRYSTSLKITECLACIETAKEKILQTSLTPTICASLRGTTRLHTTHYATKMAGNKLDLKQVEKVLKYQEHIPGYEQDENEIKAYYAALMMVEQWANKKIKITEAHIKTLHALVISHKQPTEKQTPYRDDESFICEDRTNHLIYIPPAAQHVPDLMQQIVTWINTTNTPCPIKAAIAHYQFVTIRPYGDGNRRVACLLTTLILRLGGYDLKGLYFLEEYYARSLRAYSQALDTGPSHSYATGRANADITRWVDYFIEGLAIALENMLIQMPQAITDGQQEEKDYNTLMRQLDLKQRKVLSLFQTFEIVTAKQIGELFDMQPRTYCRLCESLVEKGFLEIVNNTNKSRAYTLAKPYDTLIIEYRYRSTLLHGVNQKEN
jgi:Fic family protein